MFFFLFTTVLLELAKAKFPVDSSLGLAYLLALPEVSLRLLCYYNTIVTLVKDTTLLK